MAIFARDHAALERAQRRPGFVRRVGSSKFLFVDPKTGIAWIEDGRTGLGHSCHPNISATGSVRGMKGRGFWGKRDRTVRSHGFIYNIDHVSVRRAGRDRFALLPVRRLPRGPLARYPARPARLLLSLRF